MHTAVTHPNTRVATVSASPDGKRISSLATQDVLTLFRNDKAVHFRNFNISMDEFAEFTDRFSSDFSEYQGGGSRWKAIDREAVGTEKGIMTATGKLQDFAIPLHSEMYYMDAPPPLLWFYCEVPPEQKGQTTVCNGADLFDALPPSIQQFYCGNRIRYIRTLSTADWSIAFGTNDPIQLKKFCQSKGLDLRFHSDGSITTEYICEPVVRNSDGRLCFVNNLLYVHLAEQAFGQGTVPPDLMRELGRSPMTVRMENGKQLPDEIIAETMSVAEALTDAISWSAGDLLMIDNRVMLHGRKKSSGSQRRILVRMGQLL